MRCRLCGAEGARLWEVTLLLLDASMLVALCSPCQRRRSGPDVRLTPCRLRVARLDGAEVTDGEHRPGR